MALGEDDVLSLPFSKFVYIVAGLPFSALVICLFFSYLLHFEEATSTHCGVQNWLPSISAAVSSYAPEMYIWRLLIAIHGGPRLILAFAYRNYLQFSPLRPHGKARLFYWGCRLSCWLNIVENLFLLGLTSISSTENHGIHKGCFVGFAISATLYMILSSWLFHVSGRRRATEEGERSYEYKILACGSSVTSIIVAMYFYWRHNTYCETGVYSLFALSEYAIVLSNIIFHSTAYYDFYGKRVALCSLGGGYGYQALPMHMEKDI
ncbi:unnamed protein product [Auanema sp. JU1783]|nr:unnamed protein product [Auanema sp. JU1783]